jgi:outer membrane receptor protein involved in Fe transport
MKKLFRQFAFLSLTTLLVLSAKGQNSGTVTGNVKNSNNAESLASVSVTLKGSSQGTFTDNKGNFKLSVAQKAPYTLVFTSVGFANKEVLVDASNKVNVSLTPAYVLGSEVVVSASRASERILESPVTIERISNTTIKNAPASNYYDIIGNLKGVDVIAASLTFKSVSTRGFNVSGNVRANQLIDGMDNQAPGLNFSVGSVIGLTELDVDNIELLAGASSALYGAGGMNGTVLINSKSPFKYQGLSFQIKQGVNHIDNYERPQAPYKDYTVRWASKIGDRFAYKISAESMEGQDWLAQNTDNYNRSLGPIGSTVTGTRFTDPNYDGVNVYGDETTSPLSAVFNGVKAQVMGGLTTKYGSAASTVFNSLYGAAKLYPTVGSYTAFLKSQDASLAGAAPYLYGDAKGMFTGVNVSRTGYNEIDVIDPTTKNNKITGSIHYKVNDNTEASFSAYTGTGNTVYTGSDRYTLRNLQMTQLKLELKSKNWYVRGYQTLEDAGDTYNATIATRYFNETWSNSTTTWYPTYTAAFVSYKDGGLSDQAAHSLARATADAGRPTGHIGSSAAFQQLSTTPLSQGGAKLLDKSSLSVAEGQLSLTNALGFDKYDMDMIIGASFRNYTLNSQGTLFTDTAGKIGIGETGVYSQISKKFFGDVLKLSFAGRYDKNQNFKGQFTPRISGVIKIAEDNNFRVSYQSAYRFPTTQNQYINLLVGGGTRLMGGLPSLRDYYNFSTNPAYTVPSVNAFGASAMAGIPNPGLLQQQVFGEFKPETMTSYELGYKTLIGKKLLIDFYCYMGNYTDFIGSVIVLQSKNAAAPSPLDVLDANKRMAYSISTNATTPVSTSGWGISADYLLPGNFTFSSSLYTDELGSIPADFIPYFNTPTWRANFGFSNSGFLLNNRLGFSATMHYQDEMNYQGSFAAGKVDSYNTVDAVLTYKVPAIKSLIKAGGTNIFNKYYYTAYGSPKIGGLYYVSFAYNIF